MTIRQEISSCPTCQLENLQGAQRPQLAQPIEWNRTYPGEVGRWTGRLASSRCQFLKGINLLAMIDNIHRMDWRLSNPDWEGWGGGKKKNQNCCMKSFQGLVCPGHYKVTTGHHLLLKSPKRSLAFSSVQFSYSVVSDSATPWIAARQPLCPLPTPRVHLNSCPLSWWWHPAISSSVVPFSSCP